MKIRARVLSCLAAFALSTSAASAALITAGTNGTVLTTAPTVVSDITPISSTSVTGFNEKSGVVIGAAGLLLDIGGTLAAGTVVDSHMFLFNRETSSSSYPADKITASFSFSGTILGFVTRTGRLASTDVLLGAPGRPTRPSSIAGSKAPTRCCRPASSPTTSPCF